MGGKTYLKQKKGSLAALFFVSPALFLMWWLGSEVMVGRVRLPLGRGVAVGTCEVAGE